MRVRTEARRQAILKAAWDVFQEMGYERASMEAISRRAGGSKRTLYGYFRDKEALAIECLRAGAALENVSLDAFFEGADLRTGLERFGLARLQTTLTPGALSLRRMLWGEGGRAILKKWFGDIDTTNSTWGLLAARFQTAMDRGELRLADPWTAAQHFRGMLETDLIDRAYFGFPTAVDEQMIRQAAKDAADAFMRAYTPK
jgi:AcrR family transcriptional regulator